MLENLDLRLRAYMRVQTECRHPSRWDCRQSMQDLSAVAMPTEQVRGDTFIVCLCYMRRLGRGMKVSAQQSPLW